MAKRKMKCWICGEEATTGEHRIKHSDLKSLYPNISQDDPLYHRRDGINQKPIGSLKSDYLKSDALICAKCNNERTQKFDMAWQKISNYLQINWNKIINDGAINLLEVFPEDTIDNMTYVQLFFVKIFGCKIEESEATISLASFSESLLNELEHQDIYCSIRDSDVETVGRYGSISNIDIFHRNDNQYEIIYAHMFYTIGRVTIDLIYCPDTSYIDLNGATKPAQIMNNTIKLNSCNYRDALPVYVQSLMKEYINAK